MTKDDQLTKGSAGGKARAEVLSKEALKRIAQKAAAVRWLRAIHKGNFKDDFGIDVDCYVLNDETKTAVISQRGMGAAIGLSTRGNAFPRFAEGQAMAPYLGAELRKKIQKPLKFQWESAGALQPPSEVHGYNVELLIDVCKAILAADADGKLADNQKNVAKQARVILNASAKLGILHLVYKLAGYDATREETVAAFKFYVREEAREYEKEFPDQLYDEWYRLYELPHPEKNKPWKMMHLTVDHVYWPLAKSNGKVLELTRAKRARGNDRHKKLHQFLSEIGVKALRTQVGQLLGIARISKKREEYEGFFKSLFEEQGEINFISSSERSPPSSQSQTAASSTDSQPAPSLPSIPPDGQG